VKDELMSIKRKTYRTSFSFISSLLATSLANNFFVFVEWRRVGGSKVNKFLIFYENISSYLNAAEWPSNIRLSPIEKKKYVDLCCNKCYNCL